MVQNGSVTKVMIIFLAITLVSSSFTAFSTPAFATGSSTFIDAFVSAGSGGLDLPKNLVFGPDGNLYVLSYLNDKVKRYDGTTGAFIDTFVASGSGGLDRPQGLVFGPDGNLYVTSQNTHEVLRYNGTSGVFIDVFVSAGLSFPQESIFGPDGNLYVTSYFSDEVTRYDGISGSFIDIFISAGSGGLDAPQGLEFGPDGNLYVASQNTDQVLRYDGISGSFIDAFVSSGLHNAKDIVFGPDGHLYGTDNQHSHVERYDGATGVKIDRFVSGGMGGISSPQGLVFGPDDNLYVTSQNTNEILRFEGPFGVDNPPSMNISSPPDGTSYVSGTMVNFVGSSIDTEDGPLHFFISWNSDLDGVLGVGGPSFNTATLSLGNHTITASVTDSGGNTVSDTVLVTITPPIDSPPTVAISAPSKGSSFIVGTSVTFTGTANDVEDGNLDASLSWISDLDGAIGATSTFTTSTLSIGAHMITASVTDSFGNTATLTHLVTVNPIGSPTLSITEPVDSFVSIGGSSLTFSASATDPEDGSLSNLISWTSDIDGSIGAGSSFSMSTLSVGTHTITATVSDSDFNTSTMSITITIDAIVEEATTLVCHFPPGNPSNYHEIMIGPSALIAHKSHGDTVGKCVEDDETEKKLKIIKIKKQREEIRDKNELKEKLNELKEIKKDLNNFKKYFNGIEKQKIKNLVNEIKDVIKKLKENPEYDKEFKQILKDEIKETKLKIKHEMTVKEKAFKHKLDSKVHSLAKSDNPQRDAIKLGFDFKDGKTKIVIKLSDDDSEIVDYLSSLGTIDVKNKKHVQLTIKISDLPKLYSINGIDKIRPPFSAVQFYEELSEGVYFINADLAQFAGITGEGVKAAVLDLAFNDNEKISDNVVQVKSFRHGIGFLPIQGNGGEAVHGTAVAEILTDVAPDIELYLYSMETDIEFTAAVDEAISQQVDIIVMSAGWPNFPTDGTSHITKKIEEAVDNGIVFVVPAGNFATKHWQGLFVDSNFNNWHDYSDSDEGLSFTVTEERIEEEKPIIAHLMWDVGNGDVADFELVLVDPLGQIVDYSANEQLTKSDTPFEYIHHIPEIEGIYSLGVLYSGDMSKVSQRPSATLEIFSINDEIEHPISYSSVSVPADADGAIVVGAINHLDGVLEPFSSQGPTNNGKLAPHVVGPDGVTTLAFNGDPFYGTSATAPYVAGLAALILQTYPDISPNELLTKIQQNTDSSLFSFQNGYDYSSGYGSANAFFLIEEQGVLG